MTAERFQLCLLIALCITAAVLAAVVLATASPFQPMPSLATATWGSP